MLDPTATNFILRTISQILGLEIFSGWDYHPFAKMAPTVDFQIICNFLPSSWQGTYEEVIPLNFFWNSKKKIHADFTILRQTPSIVLCDPH